MARPGPNTNSEFELSGFNHVALVCRYMADTVEELASWTRYLDGSDVRHAPATTRPLAHSVD